MCVFARARAAAPSPLASPLPRLATGRAAVTHGPWHRVFCRGLSLGRRGRALRTEAPHMACSGNGRDNKRYSCIHKRGYAQKIFCCPARPFPRAPKGPMRQRSSATIRQPLCLPTHARIFSRARAHTHTHTHTHIPPPRTHMSPPPRPGPARRRAWPGLRVRPPGAGTGSKGLPDAKSTRPPVHAAACPSVHSAPPPKPAHRHACDPPPPRSPTRTPRIVETLRARARRRTRTHALTH